MIPGSLNTMILGGRLPPDFLQYLGNATYGITSSDPSYTAPLPTHQAGDLLVVFFQMTGGNGTATVDSSWTLQGSQNNPSRPNYCKVYTKIAESSSETFAATVFASTSFRTSIALAFRPQTGRVPQFAWLYSAYNETSFPEVTPSAGLQKYTWLPCFGAFRINSSIGTLTMPTGYDTVLGPPGGDTNYYGRLAVGLKSTEATSETPGAMVATGPSGAIVTIVAAVWEEE